MRAPVLAPGEGSRHSRRWPYHVPANLGKFGTASVRFVVRWRQPNQLGVVVQRGFELSFAVVGFSPQTKRADIGRILGKILIAVADDEVEVTFFERFYQCLRVTGLAEGGPRQEK